MFENLFKKSQPRRPTAALANALSGDGLPPGMDPASLNVLERRGSYSGRKVTYFRVYDPVRSAERSVLVREFADLDSHSELVLGSGHLEQDGVVVLSRFDRPSSRATYAHSDADSLTKTS